MRRFVGVAAALAVALAGVGIGMAAPVAGATTSTVFPSGSVWKYTDDGVSRGTAWKDVTYDDSSWKSGPAQLGYGDGDEATVMFNGGTVPAQRYISHYLRRTFTVTDANQISGLTLEVLRDDGVVVYVNGVEVGRDNMPAGTIANTTMAVDPIYDAAETTYHGIAIPPALVQEGTNLVAVSLHNESRQLTGDISFDARLIATTAGAPAPTHLHATDVGGTSVSLAWNVRPDAVSYRVYRGGVLVASPTTNAFTDTGLVEVRAYTYTVTSVNVDGDESVPSLPLTVTTADVTPPGKPTNLTTPTVGETSVVLDWDVDASGPQQVFRDGVLMGTPVTTVFTDSTVQPNRTYSYVVVAADMVGNLSVPSDPLVVRTPLIGAGTVWKYTDDGVSRGTVWKERTYNDASWKSGAAELGYGDGDETTVMYNGGTVPSQRFISHYLRRSFNVTNVASLRSLTLSVVRDDGIVVYLNGVEVIRDNMPAGRITNTTMAVKAEVTGEHIFRDFSIPVSRLRQGNNVIAVSVHNESRQGAGDISFNARLSTT